jgi:hypothetical protein
MLNEDIMEPRILNLEKFPWQKGHKIGERKCILATLELVSQIKTEEHIFVELGIFKGHTSQIIISILNELQCKSKFFGIDINLPYWSSISNKNSGWLAIEEAKKTCEHLMNGEYCVPNFIEGKSAEEVKRFEDNSISWCLVDACHCFECASADINLYAPKIIQGGMLLIHDTTPWDKKKSQWYHSKENPRPFGVLRAIKESKILKSQFKLIDHVKQGHGMQAWRKL